MPALSRTLLSLTMTDVDADALDARCDTLAATTVAPTDTRVFKLGINGTVITLRAVSHHAALYWIEVRSCCV